MNKFGIGSIDISRANGTEIIFLILFSQRWEVVETWFQRHSTGNFTKPVGKEKNFRISKSFENEAQNSKNPNFDSSVFIIKGIDSKISHLTSPYRWPQFVRQQLCSICYSFAARWPNMKHDSVFYGIFLSPELFIVESRAIAPLVGFWVYNTIKQKTIQK